MKRLWIVGLFVGILWSGRAELAAQSQASADSHPKLTIRYYNRANVPPRTLERALTVAGQIFANAGVMGAWQYGSPDSDEGKMNAMTGGPPGIKPITCARDYALARLAKGMPAAVPLA